MKKNLMKFGAGVAGAVAVFATTLMASAATYDATSSIATVQQATTEVGTILAGILAGIVAILVGLLGLGMGLRKIRRHITGGKA